MVKNANTIGATTAHIKLVLIKLVNKKLYGIDLLKLIFLESH